jgi:hypothetical protein
MPDRPAFLALWNDLNRGREAEYDAWHTREHVPERVASPGFLGGRRYVDPTHPAHRWFTLYEVEGAGAFETPQYQDLLANPTPWSASMRPDFRHFLRVQCRETARAGDGMGAALAVLRLPAGALPDIAALATADGMVGARLGIRVEGTARTFRAGAAGSGASDDFAAVLLLEALDRAAAARGFAELSASLAPGADPLALGGVYDLAFAFPGFRPGQRAAHARPGWASMTREEPNP